MKNLMIVVSLAVAAACSAQDVGFGTFNAKGYNAAYVATCVDKTSLYLEHELDAHSDYTLGIVTRPLSKSVSLVLRAEDPSWLRLGLKFGLGAGSSRTTVVALPRHGDAPTWVDVFTPSLKVVKNITLDGWLRFSSAAKPVIWVGPTIKAGRSQLWFRADLNRGTWVGGVDLPALKF